MLETMSPESGFQIAPTDHKMKKLKSRHNWLTWRYRQIFLTMLCFSCQVQLLVQFHANIITGSAVMTIFVCEGLTRNQEIGNTPVRVLRNISRLWRVRDTKFGTNVSNEKLLNTAKCQSYSFYRFRVIKLSLSFIRLLFKMTILIQ